MDKLIEKIALQTDGLLRGNLEAILADLKLLEKESDGPEVPITIKIVVSKDSVYRFGSKLTWQKGVKHSDETEMETFDPDQPDMFDKADAPLNKNQGMKICKSYAKEAGVTNG